MENGTEEVITDPGTDETTTEETTTDQETEGTVTEEVATDQGTEEVTEEVVTEPGSEETATEGLAVEEVSTDPEVVVPVEVRELTRFETDQGNIDLIHEITVGDLLVSTILFALLIFFVVSRVIRR